MDSSLHLVPGRYKLPTAPGGSLRKHSAGSEKAETKFTVISGLPACVCVCVCVCVFVCLCVCEIRHLPEVTGWGNWGHKLHVCVSKQKRSKLAVVRRQV